MFCGCLYSLADHPYSASLYSCPNVILIPHCSSAKNPLRYTRDSVASLLSPWIMACFHELYPQINKTRSVLAAGVCEARSCWGRGVSGQPFPSVACCADCYQIFTEESPLPLCICNYFCCCHSSLLSDKMSKFYFRTVSVEMGL